MKQTKRKLLTSLFNNIESKSTIEAMEYMWQQGLLNRSAVERLYISNEVARRVRAGEAKCSAIRQLSAELNCSYEKARYAAYYKNRK